MRRNLCARCTMLLIGILVAHFLAGCAGRVQSRWVDPDNVLIASSEQQIEAEFQRLFTKHRNGNERYSMTKVPATNPRFAFITAFPYRGPNIFSIYCFEQAKPNTWQLRAIIPVVEAQDAKPRFLSDNGAVKIVVDTKTILTVGRHAGPSEAMAK